MNKLKLNLNLNAILIWSVYFVQWAISIVWLAEFLLTRNAFHFTWIQLALLWALSTLTWSIKPIYWFLTDLLPIFWLRRKVYLILSSLLPFWWYIFLALHWIDFVTIATWLIIANIWLWFADVIADWLIIEWSNKENVWWYQAIAWRTKAFWIFFASLFSWMIIEREIFSSFFKDTWVLAWLSNNFPQAFASTEWFNIIDLRITFLVASILPLLTFIVALLLKEKRVSNEVLNEWKKEIPLAYVTSAWIAFVLTALSLIFISSSKTQLLPVLENGSLASLAVVVIWSTWIYVYSKHLIKLKYATPTLIYAAVFLFLWRFTPSFWAPWSDYFLNTLKLSQEKIWFISSLTPIAWIIWSFIYVKYLDKIEIKKLLFWTVIIWVILSFVQLTEATPELWNYLWSLFIVKFISSIILFPTYFITYWFSAIHELSTQAPILNLDACFSFFLEILFIVSFLPLLKLAALVTPKWVEATNFAVLASVMNLGLVFGSISWWLIYTYIEWSYSLIWISFTWLHLTIIIWAITSLFCLPVLKKLKV